MIFKYLNPKASVAFWWSHLRMRPKSLVSTLQPSTLTRPLSVFLLLFEHTRSTQYILPLLGKLSPNTTFLLDNLILPLSLLL